MGIEKLFDAPLQVPEWLAEFGHHPLSLEKPNTVFTGERSAQSHCPTEERIGGIPNVRGNISSGVNEVGVNVPIPGMSNSGYLDTEFFFDAPNLTKHLSQAGSRDCDVFDEDLAYRLHRRMHRTSKLDEILTVLANLYLKPAFCPDSSNGLSFVSCRRTISLCNELRRIRPNI